MPDEHYAAHDAEIPERTLVDLFLEAVEARPDAAAFQHFESEGVLRDISYRDALDVAKLVGAALESHGVTRGDRAAILSENRPEWALADYGCLCAGVVDVPIYSTLPPPQVAYLLRDSGAKLLFVSTPEQLEKGLEAAAECPQEVQVVVFDPPLALPAGVLTWDTFLSDGAEWAAGWSEAEFEDRARQATPGDVATVLYTSGTTGDPKGVMLTHNNIASDVQASRMVLPISGTDNTVSFLPLCHILQRMVDYLFFWVGCTIAYARSIPTLIPDMQVIRPTVTVAVPRIYEKIYNSVMQARGLKRVLVRWALGVADRAADLRLAGKEPTGLLALQYRIADTLVFSKVKKAVGGRLRFFVSGGGPLAPELNRFFFSIGLIIVEGYGLTETSPVTNVNTMEHFRIGTVGRPIPGTEVKIADDGEILVRGPQVMKGYYNKPEATAAAIDGEGWFKTGDIGEIDPDGFLKITDRKKDIIVTAGGKNVAPQPIENRLTINRFVDQAVMVGDRRRYCVLLVVPDFPQLEAWARERGIAWTDREELVANADVRAHMDQEVLGSLTDLASFERPKKMALLAEEFTIENGFLTPSLKVKRRVVQERLDPVIDGLYAEEPADAASR